MMRACVIVILSGAASAAFAQGVPLTNGSFEIGNGLPEGWRLLGEGSYVRGGVDGDRCIRVVGSGEDDSRWVTEVELEPEGLYRLSFMARGVGAAGGCIVSGPSYANRDFGTTTAWTQYGFTFRVPEDQSRTQIHLGQWHLAGAVEFDSVSLTPVIASHRSVEGLVLGAEEMVDGHRYTAAHDLGGQGSTYCRAVRRQSAGFNSSRWVFSAGAEVIYAHTVPGREQNQAEVEVNVGYYAGGRLLIEASTDGAAWHSLGEMSDLGTQSFAVTDALLPASEVLVRLRADDALPAEGHPAPGSFQIHGYTYQAQLSGAPLPALVGATRYWAVTEGALPEGVTLSTADDGMGTEVELQIAADATLQGELRARLFTGAADALAAATLGPRSEARLRLELPSAGEFVTSLELGSGDGDVLLVAQATVRVADLHDASYGYLLGDDGPVSLWWCESPHKVSRNRALPTRRSEAVSIALAGNEYEAAQIVLRSDRPGLSAQVEASDLVSPEGDRISSGDIEICEVAYLFVDIPTDETSSRGWWPDPLPPLDGPLALPEGENQPLWVTVYAQPDTPAGRYEGDISITIGQEIHTVPLDVTVYGFALTDETHVESGFGLSPGTIWDYQNISDPDDRRLVWDLYMQNYAAHRISIYDPMALAPYEFRVIGMPWEGGRAEAGVPGVPEGARCLLVEDDSETAVAQASYRDLTPIDPAGEYELAYSVLGEAEGQQVMATLNTYDAGGEWLWGCNIDLVDTAGTEWRRVERIISGRFDPRARFTRLTLRPTPWTEDGSGTGRAWFDAVRLAPVGGENLLQCAGFEETAEDLEIHLDFTEFDKAAERYLDELNLTAFALNVHGMGSGTFHSRSPGSLAGYAQDTPEYEALFSRYLGAVQEHLREKGWLEKAYVYWFDEPDPKDYEFVREGMRLLDMAAPDIRRMLTEQIEPELIGSVDLWCPLTPHLDEAAFAERQAAGEDIWWYVCTGPKAPYVTLFIDHHAIEMRVWLWQTWKHGVDGVLIWQTNYWTSPTAYPPPERQNPWEDPMGWVSGYSTPSGARLPWGNGDGRFVYPPDRDARPGGPPIISGPVNSIRWEMLRDGVEDYEYFWTLRQAIDAARARGVGADVLVEAEGLLAVPDEITSSLTEFATDPTVLLAHRDRVARAIEALAAM